MCCVRRPRQGAQGSLGAGGDLAAAATMPVATHHVADHSLALGIGVRLLTNLCDHAGRPHSRRIGLSSLDIRHCIFLHMKKNYFSKLFFEIFLFLCGF